MIQFSTLIDVDQLAPRLHRHDWVVLDCRFALDDPSMGRKRYLEGHIGRARHADLDRHLSGPVTANVSGRHPLPSRRLLSRRFRAWGMDPHDQIVAYDQADGAFAARLWWLARWLGHVEVAVLNGGIRAWVDAGLGLETDTPTLSPKVSTGHFRASRALTRTVDAEAVLAATRSEAPILDARAPERFRGDVEPIDPVAGHIPGARCVPFNDNLDASGRWRDKRSLAHRFAARATHHTICYCGSGVTATHNVLAMVHAGLPEPALYPGSWSEWIADPARPIAHGDD